MLKKAAPSFIIHIRYNFPRTYFTVLHELSCLCYANKNYEQAIQYALKALGIVNKDAEPLEK